MGCTELVLIVTYFKLSCHVMSHDQPASQSVYSINSDALSAHAAPTERERLKINRSMLKAGQKIINISIVSTVLYRTTPIYLVPAGYS